MREHLPNEQMWDIAPIQPWVQQMLDLAETRGRIQDASASCLAACTNVDGCVEVRVPR
jgi:hypothetical protein